MQGALAIKWIIIPNYSPWALRSWLQPHRLGTSDQWQLACAAPDTWDTGHTVWRQGAAKWREDVWAASWAGYKCLVTSVLSTRTLMKTERWAVTRDQNYKLRLFECWIYLNLSWMPCSRICVQIKKVFYHNLHLACFIIIILWMITMRIWFRLEVGIYLRFPLVILLNLFVDLCCCFSLYCFTLHFTASDNELQIWSNKAGMRAESSTLSLWQILIKL